MHVSGCAQPHRVTLGAQELADDISPGVTGLTPWSINELGHLVQN